MTLELVPDDVTVGEVNVGTGIELTVTFAVLFADIEAHPIDCIVTVVEPVLVNDAAGIVKLAVLVVDELKVTEADCAVAVFAPERL